MAFVREIDTVAPLRIFQLYYEKSFVVWSFEESARKRKYLRHHQMESTEGPSMQCILLLYFRPSSRFNIAGRRIANRVIALTPRRTIIRTSARPSNEPPVSLIRRMCAVHCVALFNFLGCVHAIRKYVTSHLHLRILG